MPRFMRGIHGAGLSMRQGVGRQNGVRGDGELMLKRKHVTLRPHRSKTLRME